MPKPLANLNKKDLDLANNAKKDKKFVSNIYRSRVFTNKSSIKSRDFQSNTSVPKIQDRPSIIAGSQKIFEGA